ncbi:MAG: hypothetical protein A2Z18_01200 [Armatimonadetes bacterium RBG_16_58_9]|nr:MAG: hypothetical protein A2Z18_01200 [Armatimonadetes bacterium RBG_16_58_9]
MSEMRHVFTPGILLGETHYAFRTARGVIADAVARVADEGFYGGVEISDVSDVADRKRIENTVQAHGLRLTQWMTTLLITEKLNLSSLDEDLRCRSVARMKQQMNFTAECGAHSFALFSGPDPGPGLRAKATQQLYVSFCELSEALTSYHPMRLIFEPLDRDAYKNGLIGPMSEAADLVRRVRCCYPNVGLCWDSAHVALCGEDVLESILAYHEFVDQIHLANAVLDRSYPDFGDRHMPLGVPGFLTTEMMAKVIGRVVSAGFPRKSHPMLSVEIRTPDGGDPWLTEAWGRRALEQAWRICLTEDMAS